MAKRVEKPVNDDVEVCPEEFLKTIPRIALPGYKPPTAEDLLKRREIAERMDRFREQLGPIGGSVDELIREDRASH